MRDITSENCSAHKAHKEEFVKAMQKYCGKDAAYCGTITKLQQRNNVLHKRLVVLNTNNLQITTILY